MKCWNMISYFYKDGSGEGNEAYHWTAEHGWWIARTCAGGGYDGHKVGPGQAVKDEPIPRDVGPLVLVVPLQHVEFIFNDFSLSGYG